jgi:hypothetical protein
MEKKLITFSSFLSCFSVSLRCLQQRASDDPNHTIQPHALLGCLPGRRASRRHGLQEGRHSDRTRARAARIPPRKLKSTSTRRWIGDAFKISRNTVHEKTLEPKRPRSAYLENRRSRRRCGDFLALCSDNTRRSGLCGRGSSTSQQATTKKENPQGLTQLN